MTETTYFIVDKFGECMFHGNIEHFEGAFGGCGGTTAGVIAIMQNTRDYFEDCTLLVSEINLSVSDYDKLGAVIANTNVVSHDYSPWYLMKAK